jgi:hypothetical protein
MSRSQLSIRFLPKYGLRAFCAAKILAIPAALIFLRCGDAPGLVDPRFLEPAVRRVVLNGQVMKLLLPLVSPRFARSFAERNRKWLHDRALTRPRSSRRVFE